MASLSEKPTRASVAAQARDKARLRRAQLDAERARRDEAIESAAAEFFQLEVDVEGLREQLAEAEQAQGLSIVKLRELGSKDPWIADLLEVSRNDVARLAKLAPANRAESTD